MCLHFEASGLVVRVFVCVLCVFVWSFVCVFVWLFVAGVVVAVFVCDCRFAVVFSYPGIGG